MIELLRCRSVVHHQSTDVFRSTEAFLENLARQQVLMDDSAGSGLTGGSLREEAAKGAALNPAQVVIGRILAGEQIAGDEIFEALHEQDSLIVGIPETCRKKPRAYADLGIDRPMCLHQVRTPPHDSVMDSVRLLGGLIPEFDHRPG
jgi:hypothetical protein